MRLFAVSPAPGHADDVWQNKFGHRDHRGGGRSSGRETVARVLGGAVAQMLLQQLYPKLRVEGWPSEIAGVKLKQGDFPDSPAAQDVIEKLLVAKEEGRSYGGVAALRIVDAPAGLGAPVFHKLKADLAAAMMGVGATQAFELGMGSRGGVNRKAASFIRRSKRIKITMAEFAVGLVRANPLTFGLSLNPLPQS